MKPNLEEISDLIKERAIRIEPVSGGDISDTYLIVTNSNKLFAKYNTASQAIDMFGKEANGLQKINDTNTIATPKIIGVHQGELGSYLFMEYIQTKSPSTSDLARLGHDLFNLHQISNVDFGWVENNYIGSLTQYNGKAETWLEFYIEQRLNPQFKLALSKGLLHLEEIPTETTLNEKLYPLFKNIQPNLLHGDLWSGNFLIGQDGTPYLIDPATCFGHSEVDIAMTKLFGGFGDDFYSSYYSSIKKPQLHDDYVTIYQLYYLLVHLNLFGRSYLGSVKKILSTYF